VLAVKREIRNDRGRNRRRFKEGGAARPRVKKGEGDEGGRVCGVRKDIRSGRRSVIVFDRNDAVC